MVPITKQLKVSYKYSRYVSIKSFHELFVCVLLMYLPFLDTLSKSKQTNSIPAYLKLVFLIPMLFITVTHFLSGLYLSRSVSGKGF